jgi:hypothetical protein
MFLKAGGLFFREIGQEVPHRRAWLDCQIDVFGQNVIGQDAEIMHVNGEGKIFH